VLGLCGIQSTVRGGDSEQDLEADQGGVFCYIERMNDMIKRVGLLVLIDDYCLAGGDG
jgi:hypothetical protein